VVLLQKLNDLLLNLAL